MRSEEELERMKRVLHQKDMDETHELYRKMIEQEKILMMKRGIKCCE